MKCFLVAQARVAIWLMGVLRMDNEELKQKLQAFLDADKDYDYAKDSADFALDAHFSNRNLLPTSGWLWSQSDRV